MANGKKGIIKRVLKVAVLGAIVGWFVKRQRADKGSEEWRDMFDKKGEASKS